MKTEPNQPIQPQISHTETGDNGAIITLYATNGLTKREYFAAMTLQGIITTMQNVEVMKGMQKIAVLQNKSIELYISELAVEQADALITALNNQ